MAYSGANLVLLKTSPGGGPQLWLYSSADAHGDVDATDYFADGAASEGMRVGDVVIVVDTSLDTTTLHHVTAKDSDGNKTISAATLA